MASPVPAKSQTLLSFSLPQWKLTKNHTNNHHRGRRAVDSSLQQLPPSDSLPRQSPARMQSPMRDSASETESSLANPDNRKKSVSNGSKNGSLESSLDHAKADKQSCVLDIDKTGTKESRSKIYIRFRSNSNSKTDEVQEEGKTELEEGEVEETLPKTWNLRPRKPVRKQSNSPGANSSLGRTSSPDNHHHHNKSQSPQMASKRADMRNNQQEITEKKYKKQKFSISLSRDEIEEDIFAINGSKPVRRPKKRSKIVQRQLDSIFPGLWLSSITLDSYKVPEYPSKV